MGCGVITKFVEENGLIKPGVNAWEDKSKDFNGAGTSAKVIELAAGDHVIKHKHPYSHLSLLVSGIVQIQTDDKTKMLTAPTSIIIEAHQYHSLKAITDAVWICLHTEAQQARLSEVA